MREPGSEVRLRYAYIIKCEEVIKDENGEIIELICSYDPETKSGVGTSTKKVKSAIHWVSDDHAIAGHVSLFETLYSDPNPDSDSPINPDSLGFNLKERGISFLMRSRMRNLYSIELSPSKTLGQRYKTERNNSKQRLKIQANFYKSSCPHFANCNQCLKSFHRSMKFL